MNPLRAVTYLLIFIAVVAVVALTTGARAQQQCYERDKLLASLKKQYNEHSIGFGTVPTNLGPRIVEMSLSDDGSWTIYVIEPNGVACVMVSGHEWQFLPEEPETQKH